VRRRFSRLNSIIRYLRTDDRRHLLFLAIGLPITLGQYCGSVFRRIDPIGSTTLWTRIEPPPQKVTLTRVIGIAFVIAAVYLLGTM